MQVTVIRGWERTWPATPESVGEVRRAVAHAAREAGFGELRLHELRLAVTEACANAIMHAGGGDGSCGFEVAVSARGDALEVAVRDHGGGMRSRPDSPGAGFGLSIIGQLADDVELDTPPGGGTRVRMRFCLPA